MDSLTVTVKNGSSHNLYIVGDPSWDDQDLTVDGKPMTGIFALAPKASVVIGLVSEYDYNEMGLIFAEGENYDFDPGDWFYELTIKPDPDTGKLSVVGGPMKFPIVKYTLKEQTPQSMTMHFVDINDGYTIATVKNNSAHHIDIYPAPNWDDEILMINGIPMFEAYELASGFSATVVIDGNEMGTIFDAHDAGFYQLKLGYDRRTGKSGVLEYGHDGNPLVHCRVEHQAKWSFTMNFIDA